MRSSLLSCLGEAGGWGGAVYEHDTVRPLDRLATVGRRLSVFARQPARERSDLDEGL